MDGDRRTMVRLALVEVMAALDVEGLYLGDLDALGTLGEGLLCIVLLGIARLLVFATVLYVSFLCVSFVSLAYPRV